MGWDGCRRRLAEEGEEAEDLDVRGVHLRVAREPLRTVTVTDLAYVDGTLLVAGASNEEFSSTLRRIPFPFEAAARRNSLEIYQGVTRMANLDDTHVLMLQREPAGSLHLRPYSTGSL